MFTPGFLMVSNCDPATYLNTITSLVLPAREPLSNNNNNNNNTLIPAEMETDFGAEVRPMMTTLSSHDLVAN